jgi:hypothetical protein
LKLGIKAISLWYAWMRKYRQYQYRQITKKYDNKSTTKKVRQQKIKTGW